MQLLFATSNSGKLVEIREALAGTPVDLKTLSDIDATISQPHETGDTFAQNALQKARYYFDHTHIPTFADDSGIMVHALAGELGIHTRRWGAGPHASDKEWIEHFLSRMSKENNKRASFICCIAYIDEHGNEYVFEGHCDGVITDELEAEYLPGLPISACFKPDGYEKVFSALSVDEKNRVSHRGKAMSEFVQYLNSKM